ncbi:MAG: hypothetical protein Q8R13_02470 [bacterium]|nr:hypothetical protein [bacterium]
MQQASGINRTLKTEREEGNVAKKETPKKRHLHQQALILFDYSTDRGHAAFRHKIDAAGLDYVFIEMDGYPKLPLESDPVYHGISPWLIVVDGENFRSYAGRLAVTTFFRKVAQARRGKQLSTASFVPAVLPTNGNGQKPLARRATEH